MNATRSAGLAELAEHLQSYGRNGDTVLVHMTKEEVRGLQALAVHHGGTLTINPHTGLVEASFLKKLLPTIAGIALNFVPGVGPLLAAGITAAGSAAASGSLKKGLMAGLQAYGGASLATSMGLGTATRGLGAIAPGAAPATVPSATSVAAPGPVNLVNTPASLSGASGLGAGQTAANLATGAPPASLLPSQMAPTPGVVDFVNTPASIGGPTRGGLMGMLPQDVQAFGDRFAAASREGLPAGAPETISKYAPWAAGLGLYSTASGLMQPKGITPPGEPPSNYSGPYIMNDRQVRFRGEDADPNDTSEFEYFTPVNAGVRPMTPEERTAFGYPSYRPPEPIKTKPQNGRYPTYAKGGEVLEPGSFVLDARTVSELGNGSSEAGQEALKRVGGKPIKGKGDGVSDSIPANVRGRAARVARDEVKMPPEAVRRVGGGSHRRGAARLYALMDKAKQARRVSERGSDSGLVSLLGA